MVESAHPPRSVLVVFESGANGAAAIRRGAAAASRNGGGLEVVTLARQEPNHHRCGPSARAYNCAIREAAQEELCEARDLLASFAAPVTFRVLAGEPEPPLAAWVAEHEFHSVFVPRHRLARGGHWAARMLRGCTTAEVELVG